MKFALTKEENAYPASMNETERLSIAHTFMDNISLQILAGLMLGFGMTDLLLLVFLEIF